MLSTCKSREDEIMIAGMGLVTGEACSVLRLVDRLAVDEPAKAPAAGRGVFVRILDHDLNRRGGAGDKGAVNTGHRHMLPGQLSQDRSIREWRYPLSIGLQGDVVAKHAPEFIEPGFMRHRDHLPVSVPFRNPNAEDRR